LFANKEDKTPTKPPLNVSKPACNSITGNELMCATAIATTARQVT